jgi:hypothetical protein
VHNLTSKFKAIKPLVGDLPGALTGGAALADLGDAVEQDLGDTTDLEPDPAMPSR